MRSHLIFLLLVIIVGCSIRCTGETTQWSVEKANSWYQNRGWVVGCNYIPSSASNQLEMWQQDTFDLTTIKRELAWAKSLGFNSLRVFLHNLLWDSDAAGFLSRMDMFLDVAQQNGLGVVFVLFDSCWDAMPKLGVQRDPVPFVHNSRWVQSPGLEILADPTRHDEMKGYVQGVVSHFANDSRIIFWDVFNEPDNINRPAYLAYNPPDKSHSALLLLTKAYDWMRQCNPSQPLSSGVWAGDWNNPTDLQKFQLEQSDIISFHCYDPLPSLQARVASLRPFNRPIINTEYMARPVGSTFNPILGWFKQQNIGAHNWGFVSGKTQTVMPWDSWCTEYNAVPQVWFHDIFTKDGTPFSNDEVAYIRNVTNM